MSRLRIGLLALLALTGCGGGGSGGNNDPPTTTGTSATLNEDAGATNITIAATDPDNDTLTMTVTSQPTKGVVAVTGARQFSFTPAANQNGADQFTYSVRDPGGLSATATVNLTITPQPDAPQAPDANIATNEDVPGAATVTATDIDGDALTAAIVTAPAHGAVNITGTNPFTFTYTPTLNANGADSFAYQLQDPSGASDLATVNVTIAAQPDAPALPVINIVTAEDAQASGSFGATDVDGDAVTVIVNTPPAHGTLQVAGGNYVYMPAADFHGADSFAVVASDGTLQTGAVQIPVTVTSVNDAPVAAADVAVIPATGATNIDVLLNDSDADGDSLTVEIVTSPPGANAVVAANQVRVTPSAGALGPNRLSYRVRDPNGGEATATVRIVMGDPAPLYFTTSAAMPPGKRIFRYDFLGAPVQLATPLPAGESLERFTISANGARMVYVSRNDAPLRHRLWLRDLDDLSAPVTEITTGAGFVTNYLKLSPDGALVVFNDNYAETSAPTVSNAVDAGNTIENPTFSANSQRLYYTVLLAGGGRVIKRADVDVNGALANRLQMTASYAAGEGLGRSFVLTPDEAQIVSAGLFFVGGAVNAYKQHAFVTTADGSQDDTQLHPNLVHPLDGAGLPLVTANSRYGYYVYRVNFVDHLGWADLQAPGTNTGVLTAINPFSKILLAGDSQHVFLEASEGGIEPWKLVENVSTPVFNGFNPVGGGVSAPREVAPAPDGTAVIFDGGAGIYATLGNQFTTATLLFARPVSTEPAMKYAPDSASVAIADPGESGLYIVNPKAPGWWENLGTPAAPGALCMAYPGEGC